MSEHGLDRSPSPSEDSTSYSMSDISWTVRLMELPPELQAEVFLHLPNCMAAVALRLCCRQLNEVLLQNEKRILSSLRELLVAPFREFYDFLQRLKLPANSVKLPPPSGWPNMTPVACAGLDKTPFAIDVLRHLPYIDELHVKSNETNIDYKCNAVDYSKFTSDNFSTYREEEFWALEWQGVDEEERISGIKHVVMIAEGYESGGIVLLLDTFTGTIFEEIVRTDSGVRLPPDEYFRSRMERLRKLDQIFVAGFDPWKEDGNISSDDFEAAYDADHMESQGEPVWAEGDFDQDEMFLWVRHLHRKFGWPGPDWKKGECMEAVEDFVQRLPIW
ncbi:hypothetical protein QBC33DRAFT_556675 [Phialemonium atrogriseum]|uniref:F-box domain-containing protein n=1 Tax=Phialemonium atrogriseum TaxID=1093897 RepID=A0AAJ0C7T7_9PEZI|nr:uncharacterized protein QBC33DRAFT_556675 [Phialemonium atrogriseum]KAK1770254.1 hypothetical protein QBC33DRAFT_556675 [Phialemonium atrogriseum]